MAAPWQGLPVRLEVAVKRVRAAVTGTPGRAKPPRVASGSLRAGKRALATPGRPGVRKIAARFGVNPGTGSGSAAKDDWYCSARRVRPLVSGEHKDLIGRG